MIRLCLAGATGWAGSALARAVAATPDIRLVAAVSRTHAGRSLGDVLAEPRLDAPVFGTAAEALDRPADVFFDYTKPTVALPNVMTALERGLHVVVGTSGLTDDDYRRIHAAAVAAGREVLAVGNFAIPVVLLQRFAETAARYLPSWEIIDYASERKVDAPSGTARELAHRLSSVRPPATGVPLEATMGERAARGADLGGSRVHSIRLPGFSLSTEVVFGMPGQRLALRHDAGPSAEPYVDGALLAIRAVGSVVGLRRGLDQVMDF